MHGILTVGHGLPQLDTTKPRTVHSDSRPFICIYTHIFSNTSKKYVVKRILTLNRVFKLLERVTEFCDKRQLVTVNKALLSIAVNATDISRAVSSLDKRPALG